MPRCGTSNTVKPGSASIRTAQRTNRFVAVRHERASDVPARIEPLGELRRGEQRSTIDQIRVGEEGDDPLARGYQRGVPPSVRVRLDHRSGVLVGTRCRAKTGIEGDEDIVAKADGTDPTRDHAPAAGRINQPVTPHLLVARVARSQCHPPARAVTDCPDKSRGGGHLHAAVAGGGAECCIKPATVEMPATTVRIEDEVGRGRFVAAPHGYVAVAGQVGVGQEGVEDAKVT